MLRYEDDHAVLDSTNPGTDRLAYRDLEALICNAVSLACHAPISLGRQMIVEKEAASFIGSVLKGRISPNRALGTYLLLVLLLLDFLLFLYLLVVSIDRNYVSC